ncbi:MAG: 5-(carboxyamino)imidazole ribonucleotide synthase [Halobacteriaceae archaeon]
MTDTDTLTADPVTLGVVGGGQLGRMLAEAAGPLGVEVLVLDPTPDCPAAAVARDQIVADFDDREGVRELADRSDVVTVEIELADPDLLAEVRAETGVPVHPDPESVRTTRDKLVEASTLADAGVPVPPFRGVDTETDLREAFDDLGAPLMLKARRGGYDGRGNEVVASVADAESAFGDLSGLVAEELVDFERELSVMGVRGAAGTDTYPVVENVHEAEILRETVAPARTDERVRERAASVARDVLASLDGRGVFGIEMFETSDGEVLVNEIAPRPHNSGHYTIEAATAGQFEQHVRATLGMPLGRTTLRGDAAMVNILGGVEEASPVELTGVHDALARPGVHLHWYGKREARPLRKMGHLTATAADGVDDPLVAARDARDDLTFE